MSLRVCLLSLKSFYDAIKCPKLGNELPRNS